MFIFQTPFTLITMTQKRKLMMFKKYFLFILLVSFLIPCSAQEIKFGVITDVHHGYTTDVHERLQLFIDAATEEEVDFIIELGDFSLAMNDEETGSFKDIWDSFDGPKYYVLGNHDMDENSKQDVRDYLGIESNYYTFNMHGIHFIVMDDNHIKDANGNLIDYDHGNYHGANRDWFGDEQLSWVTQDLANTDQATVVFRHAGIQGKEQRALENIISDANASAGYKKVLLALNGHGHKNEEEIVDGVPYVEIPSASYVWNNHQAEPYTTANFAFVTINTTNGTLGIDGRSEDIEYQEGLPTHVIKTADRSYTFLPIGIKSSFTPSTTECSSSVSFENTSSESAESYHWDFGDGQKSTEESPVHIYYQAGNYTIQLTIQKGFTGHQSDKTITVVFAEKPSGSDGSRDSSGTVVLSASVSDGGTINWYDEAVGGTVLGTGTSFTTPLLFETTSYYAENKTGDGCKSVREKVVATINWVGVEDVISNNRIKIYPNPSSGIVNISIDRSIENLSISVYNTNGQCVKAKTFDHADDVLLDLNELPKGTYFIKLMEKGNVLVDTSIIMRQ